MKRWKTMLAGAALAAGTLTGCKQPLYMSKTDHEEMKALGLPKDFESDPMASYRLPPLEARKPPPNVLDPDRPARYLSLAEAFAIALENGTEGQFNLAAGGSTSARGGFNEFLTTFTGGGVNADDSVRVFSLDPATIGAEIEASLARFDARWINSLSWQKQDNAVQNTLANFNNGDIAQFQSGLFKPLPTGGLAGITFETDYTRLTNPPTSQFQVVNPAYRPALTFQFEQPLMRNYGVDMNQLLPTFPGSTFAPGIGQPQTGAAREGILVTRVRFDQSRTEFERRVNNMIVNVEITYWNLYAAYFALYAAEQGMRQAYLTYRLTEERFEAGATERQSVAQVRAQFESFRAQRVAALQDTLEAERQLRGLLAMPTDDGQRIVPADAPTLAPYTPDWNSAVGEMFANRPELQLLRQELKARQLDVILNKNFTRPDLRLTASYNINGIGTTLDGPGADNALRSLTNNNFNTWTLGLRYDVTLGYREAHAAVRIARLNLARILQSLKSQEKKAELTLENQYQQLSARYEIIRAQRAQRLALTEQLSGLVTLVTTGRATLIVLLDAQRNYAAALAAEHRAIADYNSAIASFQYAKGTILTYNNINIAEGPLPPLTLRRAVDHYEERTRGIVTHERATLPTADCTALPGLLEHAPKVPELPDAGAAAPSPTPFDPMSNIKLKGTAEPIGPPQPSLPTPQIVPPGGGSTGSALSPYSGGSTPKVIPPSPLPAGLPTSGPALDRKP
jgi:outer membrane protein TolC